MRRRGDRVSPGVAPNPHSKWNKYLNLTPQQHTSFGRKTLAFSRLHRLRVDKLFALVIDERDDIFPNHTVSAISVAGRNKTVDQGLSLPLALLGRAEIFMALKEYHFALEDLRMAAEHDLPDKSM